MIQKKSYCAMLFQCCIMFLDILQHLSDVRYSPSKSFDQRLGRDAHALYSYISIQLYTSNLYDIIISILEVFISYFFS